MFTKETGSNTLIPNSARSPTGVLAGSVILRHDRDTSGRIITADFNNGTRIINVYAPCRYGQREVFDSLEDWLAGPARVALLGD